MSQRIGLIGLGTMGQPMAGRLLDGGYGLVLFNRTSEKTEWLVRKGSTRVTSAREVGEECSVSITMVSDDQALTDVVMGDTGLYKGLGPKKIHIDMSTISPTLARTLDQRCRSKDAAFLHAPVLGSKPQAAAGTLLIFVGGSEVAYRRCKPIFDVLGKRTWHWAEVTKASFLKLICNQFIACMITALTQGLVMAKRAGLEAETLMEVLGVSALNAPMYQSKARKISQRDFADANFYVAHMAKDIKLILQAGGALGVPQAGLHAISELFATAIARGYGQEDYSAIIKVLEEEAGIKNS